MPTPLYPVNSPVNGINQGLFPFKVNRNFFRESVEISPLYHLMGNETNRPIVINKPKAGEGWEYRVPKLNSIDFTRPILDFDQVSGSGQYQKVDMDKVSCHKYSFAVTLKGRDLIDFGAPVDGIEDSVRAQLVEATERSLNKMILDSAMYNYSASTDITTGAYSLTTSLPAYDRVLLGGPLAPGGNAQSSATDRTNYYNKAGITTVCNAMATGPGYNQNGLSALHLLRLKRLAISGGYRGGATILNGNVEDPIRPAYFRTKDGWPVREFIYFTTAESLENLIQDPMFTRSTVERGTVVNRNQPQLIDGSVYFGEFRGIHIYEIKDLSSYIFTSQDTNNQVAWELFIGAGAWSLGWYKEPYVSFKDNQIDSIQEFATHEIRGQKSLWFPSKQPQLANGVYNGNVEQGIIHSFVRVG